MTCICSDRCHIFHYNENSQWNVLYSDFTSLHSISFLSKSLCTSGNVTIWTILKSCWIYISIFECDSFLLNIIYLWNIKFVKITYIWGSVFINQLSCFPFIHAWFSHHLSNNMLKCVHWIMRISLILQWCIRW